MMTSPSLRAIVQLAAVLAITPHVFAEEFSYEEINTLNLNMEPAREHFDRGDGFLYGASRDKMAGKGGMIYRLAPGQPVEVLHEFFGPDDAPMVNTDGAGFASIKAVGPDGAFYGTTETGGPEGLGVLFRYAVDGTFSIIDAPTAAGLPVPTDMVVTASGDIYGVSEKHRGDTNGSNNYGGCLFKRAADGTITILHTFSEPAFVPSPFPGTRPRPSQSLPVEGPAVAPYAPYRICEGPDGKLYGITFAGGEGHGTFFSFDLATNTLAVLADLDQFNDWPREISPAEGGFHVLVERRLLHISYTGTITVEIDATTLPNYAPWGADFRGPIVTTPDGVFVETPYGGATGAGYVARFRPDEGATVVYNFTSGVSGQQRVISAGTDGKIYGLTGYPEEIEVSEDLASGPAETETAKAAKKKLGRSNPTTFRFRKAGDSLNFPPLANLDSAWLPAKASKTGTREVTVDILANDKDPDKQPLTVTSVTSEGSASATVVQTKKGARLKISTNEANPASQVVTYQLSDGNGGTSTGMVAVCSPVTGTFSGPILPALAESPAGTVSVKISGKNSVAAAFTVAGKKFTGSGTLDVDDSTNLLLRLRGQSPIAFRADVVRSGAKPQLEVRLPYGGTVYSATLDASASKP